MTTAQFEAWQASEHDLDNGEMPDDFAELMETAEQDRRDNPLDDPAIVAFLDGQELLPRAA